MWSSFPVKEGEMKQINEGKAYQQMIGFELL